MHTTDLSRWKHNHDFSPDFSTAEKNTRRVLILTVAMMIAEVIFGLEFNSMALFADGLHMGTHVAAFLITVLAYFLPADTRRMTVSALERENLGSWVHSPARLFWVVSAW